MTKEDEKRGVARIDTQSSPEKKKGLGNEKRDRDPMRRAKRRLVASGRGGLPRGKV